MVILLVLLVHLPNSLSLLQDHLAIDEKVEALGGLKFQSPPNHTYQLLSSEGQRNEEPSEVSKKIGRIT